MPRDEVFSGALQEGMSSFGKLPKKMKSRLAETCRKQR
jgi:hypothetical protein